MASIPTSPIGKVFVDSTVFVAAAISSHGSARDLLLLCLRGGINLAISPLVLLETERNIRSKAPSALGDFLRTYNIVIETDGKSYSAFVPDLPGCVATGRSIVQVQERMRGAIEMHIAGMLEDGDTIPEPSTMVWSAVTVVSAA